MVIKDDDKDRLVELLDSNNREWIMFNNDRDRLIELLDNNNR